MARVGRWAGPGLLGAVAVAALPTGAAYAALAAWPALLGDPHDDWVHDLLRAALALLVAVAAGYALRRTVPDGAGRCRTSGRGARRCARWCSAPGWPD
ncbi:hypothetical protein [Streptomyces noursei]|uniref:hypothetical protein n=1 Tax=Streptomyces noursei TaxID=1971 RepID=UPI0023B78501|nr:hypothetical protein [Streptomyces noursei]